MTDDKQASKWRILFVDDDPSILSGIRRSLHPLRHKWEMSFETDPLRVPGLVVEQPPHVVISDMRMPGLNGAVLLQRIMDARPEIIRIILSGYADLDISLQAVKPTHLFLNKPCPPDRLVEILARMDFLLSLPVSAEMRAAMGRITSLPMIPETFRKLQSLLESPTSDMSDIAKLISQDVALTAKCLQLINSAFFGLSRRIANTSDAVKLLGLETLKGMVLQFGVFSQFEGKRIPGHLVDTLTQHCQQVGILAQKIAHQITGDRREGDVAFSTGLLHEVGQLVLLSSFPDQAGKTIDYTHLRDGPDWRRQQETMGIDHGLVGAFLLSLWGLPEPVVEATMYHHDPARAPHATPILTAIHVADGLLHCRKLGLPWERAEPWILDREWLAATQMIHHLPAWNDLANR